MIFKYFAGDSRKLWGLRTIRLSISKIIIKYRYISTRGFPHLHFPEPCASHRERKRKKKKEKKVFMIGLLARSNTYRCHSEIVSSGWGNYVSKNSGRTKSVNVRNFGVASAVVEENFRRK